MDNATRRELLQRHKMSGFPGSIMDVYQAYGQGVDLIEQYEQQQVAQQQPTAEIPQQPTPSAPQPPAAQPQIKANIQSPQAGGNLVKSYDNQSLGLSNLGMGSQEGMQFQMQTGGQKDPSKDKGDYNMARALELGYEPNEEGHWPSVDDTNGMWLKSTKHPTMTKEFLYGYLSGDHYKTHDLVINPEGYFGENQLQYIPKREPAPRMGVRQNPDKSVSTHKYATETIDGKWYSFPTLFQNPDSSWVDMEPKEGDDWYPAYEEALRRGEVIDFGKDMKGALEWGMGSWKEQKQTGGPTDPPKWQGTIDKINQNWGPDQIRDTLDLNTLDLVAIEQMGVQDPEGVRVPLKYHETGPYQRFQSNAVQLVGEQGNFTEGVGKGHYMYDQPSTLRDAKRLRTISNNMGLVTPQFALDLIASEGTANADTLTADQQDMLMMSNLIMDPKAPFRAYGAGNASIEDLWYHGVNRGKNEEKARAEFRESMRGLRNDDLNNYMFMEPKPNYFEQRRFGGIKRKRRGGPTDPPYIASSDNTRINTPLPPQLALNAPVQQPFRDQGTIRQAPDEVETMSVLGVLSQPLKALEYYSKDSNRGSLPTQAEFDAQGSNPIDQALAMVNPAAQVQGFIEDSSSGLTAAIPGIKALKGAGSMPLPPRMSREQILAATKDSGRTGRFAEMGTLNDYGNMQLQGLRERGALLDKNFGDYPASKFLSDDAVEYMGSYSGRPVVGVQMPDRENPLHYYLSSGLAGKKKVDGSSSRGTWVPFPGWSDNYLESGFVRNWFNKDAGWENAYDSRVMQSISDELTPHLAKRYFGEEGINQGLANEAELFEAMGLAVKRKKTGGVTKYFNNRIRRK